jgi:N-acetylmuramic acid 6-phosphate etherase
MPTRSKWQSLPTEAINPASVGLDKLAPVDFVDLMNAEDRKVLLAVQHERERLAVGIEMLATCLRRGGRVVFVGAGTSGRLGILESAEMPPTFSTDPLLVQALMAGGRDAIFGAKEGGEDNFEEGARAMMRFNPTRLDIVVGVSASGMTQFVRGGLTKARKAGARIIFVTCDPATELQTFVDLTIAPAVGAEVIAGSTRLKAGTATKLVLNILTTGAMVRIGKTYGNLMVDVHTGSEKLKDRACRIVNIVTGLDYEESEKLLSRAHWNVKAAIVMQKTGLPIAKALARLRKAHDSMREAIGEDIEPRLHGMLQGHAEAAAATTGPTDGQPKPARARRVPRKP